MNLVIVRGLWHLFIPHSQFKLQYTKYMVLTDTRLVLISVYSRAVLRYVCYCLLHREGKSASSGVTNYTEVTNTSAGSECCGDDLSCSQNGLQKLLLEAHRCIGDPDAIYGCGVCSVPDSTSR